LFYAALSKKLGVYEYPKPKIPSIYGYTGKSRFFSVQTTELLVDIFVDSTVTISEPLLP
jgi:hypothetical protein